MTEDDESKIEEAKQCNHCFCWHKHCAAECCKICYIRTSPAILKTKKKFLDIHAHLTPDLIWYYKLRGVKYRYGVVRFELDKCVPDGDRIMYVRQCDLLDENLRCKGHPDNKPEICKYLTEETAKNLKENVILTNNCLFKYKLMGVDKNEGKTSSKEKENSSKGK